MNDRACDRIDDYLCGWLPPDEAAAYEAHVADCAACREECARQRHLDQLLAEATVATAFVPAGLRSRVRGRIRTARRWRAFGWAGAVAATAVVAVTLGIHATRNIAFSPREERQTAQGSSAGNDAPPPVAGPASEEPAVVVARVTASDPSAAIVMPLESHHPNVTIIRVYPTIAATPEDESADATDKPDLEKPDIE